ncbi:hypothetical protein COV93_03025 [Candidatus Woesearchaeota archaeon CG11_big_fil_rev_8_21_14_0_20_43_8]|nr:MAG: hypothetical protein COV93_03025 [Candidatus Woesearchaeota archaeon CG11_big_fil_rev_8_21_14_0_20_43_8]
MCPPYGFLYLFYKPNAIMIQEGMAKLALSKEEKISKKLPVFYNPIMKLNRDISIFLLNALGEDLSVGDIMAGSGVRAIRFLLECENIASVTANDMSINAIKSIKENCALNGIEVIEGEYAESNKTKKLLLHNKDARMFLLESGGFGYIDVDPFGSPCQFLPSACERLARGGILAVTATDTSALSGTYLSACRRKYWSNPLRNHLMHEVGLRILIRRCQLSASQYDKALLPIYSFSTDHYMRVFFRCEKGKKKTDDILKEHRYLLYCNKCGHFEISDKNDGECCSAMQAAGPLWVGQLWDASLAEKMAGSGGLMDIIAEEAKVPSIGFFDVHVLSKLMKLGHVKRNDAILSAVKSAGYKVARTHLSQSGYRTDMPLDEFKKILGA